MCSGLALPPSACPFHIFCVCVDSWLAMFILPAVYCIHMQWVYLVGEIFHGFCAFAAIHKISACTCSCMSAIYLNKLVKLLACVQE